jgi:hypothetical protein
LPTSPPRACSGFGASRDLVRRAECRRDQLRALAGDPHDALTGVEASDADLLDALIQRLQAPTLVDEYGDTGIILR